MNTQAGGKPTRPSTDTDHRHLLSESPTASRATSIVGSGQTTPRATSITRCADVASGARRAPIANHTPQPYKGFPSEEHYLAALHEWAESKKYVEPDTTLVGYYGQTTMEEYANRPRVELGIRRKLKEWKEKKEAKRSGDKSPEPE